MEYLLEILGSGSLKKHGRRDDRLQIQMYLSFHYSEKRMIDEFTLILQVRCQWKEVPPLMPMSHLIFDPFTAHGLCI